MLIRWLSPPRFVLRGYFLSVGETVRVLTEVNSVTIDTSPNPGRDLHFHLDGGPLGPGNFSEPDGSSEIEFTVTGFTAASASRNSRNKW